MRVGVDASSLFKHQTGVGNYVAQLLDELCRQRPGDQYFLYSNNPIHFHGYPNVTQRVSLGTRVVPWWMHTALVRDIKQDRLDVFWAASGMGPVNFPRQVPIVITLYDLVYHFAPETMSTAARWSRRWLQPTFARRASGVISISQTTADDVMSLYGIRSQVVIHPQAADYLRRPHPDAIRALRARLALPSDYWLVVGTLEPRKNLAAFLRAYQQVRAEGVDLPLLALAGSKGWRDTAIEALISACESAGWVKRLGFVPNEDLAALYAGCACCFMPSLYEGFGMPLVEAQQCGAAVAHGGHASMVEASAGLGVVTGTSVGQLAQAMRAIASQELPLSCRLPGDIDNDPQGRAALLGRLLEQAATRSVPS